MRWDSWLLAWLVIGAVGCELPAGSKPKAPPAAVPLAQPTPRVLTSLSALTPGNPEEILGAKRLSTPPPELASPSATPNALSYQANLKRLFLEKPESGRFAGTAATPGEERLANAKAAQFSLFTRALLHQVFVAAQDLERKEISREELPTNLGKVVLTATMDQTGRLKELIVEQSSGSGAVDQLMIKACKIGLWTRNPPPAALTAEGTYRIRIEASIRNFARPSQEQVWNFDTRLALGLE